MSGKSLFTIADPTSAIVELEVLEQYSALLSVGQEVTLTVGSSAIKGSITSIGKVAQQSSDGLGATVSVKVKPQENTTTLLLGNTAVGEINLGTKQGALLLKRGPYLTTGSQKWLYVVKGNTAVRTAVTFGETQGNTVEILSGVSAGEEVITSGYQNFIEYERITLEKGDSK
jgi:HlyD family secretion protein